MLHVLDLLLDAVLHMLHRLGELTADRVGVDESSGARIGGSANVPADEILRMNACETSADNDAYSLSARNGGSKARMADGTGITEGGH